VAGDRARGEVLDLFAYHGSFALHAARNADRVLAVDSSRTALERAGENAARNGLDNVEVLEANAFDALRAFGREGRRFDTILLDPPAFARSRRDVDAARRGYREINLRAMRLLGDDGILVTSSCSYNLGEPAFTDVLAEAAADAGRSFVVLERRTQAPCHPIRLGFPESQYLKCLVLRNRTA
jgi:23S rRNA (cytosine1962-C5)-methyltransferase